MQASVAFGKDALTKQETTDTTQIAAVLKAST
jgi:hypothetical protein